MKLSKFERYLLANQLQILEALYPDEAEGFAVQREALEHGYEFIYAMHTDHIYDGDDKMTDDECREVWDTMDMFLSIDGSLEKIGRDGFDDQPMTKFVGYDGNNEAKFMSFASYTVKRLKRFTHLPVDKPNYFNSHMPTRDIYGRMLTEWKKIPDSNRFSMSSDQLQQVLQAAVHPDNRD